MPAGSPFHLIDLLHLDRPESVAAAVLPTPDGALLVDPGPASTLPALRAGLASLGLALSEVRALLLTHIHLDHAGASGTLARMNPELIVFVHEAGAPHLVDPSRLLASAERLYGDRMGVLWGEVAAVPAGQVHALAGGERIAPGGRRLEVASTPGHARHHLSYLDGGSGTAFVGDTAGIRGPRLPIVLPVTPPPEYDLAAWLASIDRILAWHPTRLFLTHFGPATDPPEHFEALRGGLRDWTGIAERSLALPGSDGDRVRAFITELEAWVAARTDAERARAFLDGAGPEACWQGIARYLRGRS